VLCVTEIGKQAEDYMKRGALVPDNIMQKMIIDEMKRLKGETWLLDGNLLNTAYLVMIFYG
jgi:adenylate kinase family enzyme